MKQYAKYIWPVLIIGIIEVVKFFPGFIEHYYSSSLYPYIGKSLRFFLGWIPFSIGDILIGATIVWILVRVIACLGLMVQGRPVKTYVKEGLLGLIRPALWLYICFYVLWGLNYYRLGSSYLFGISPDTYTTEELDFLTKTLHQKIIHLCRDSVAINSSQTRDRNQLIKEADQAFKHAHKKYPFFHLGVHSIKPNLLGPLQSYTGYAGYLFPLTGEAHVNFYIPAAGLPFTVCHEMAHQAGFGTESEANLVGFITARESPNRSFQYSAYTGAFQYAVSELYLRDSLRAEKYMDSLPIYFKQDQLELREFSMAHRNPFQPVLNAIYNLYLQGNNQPEGLASYNYLVAWLIAYSKKNGWEKL